MDEKYPECRKLDEVSEKYQTVCEFLEWLQDKKEIALARWYHDPYKGDELIQICDSVESLLAEFFKINMKKVEKERKQILKELKESK